MFRAILVCLLFCFAFIGLSKAQSNPFDLKFRASVTEPVIVNPEKGLVVDTPKSAQIDKAVDLNDAADELVIPLSSKDTAALKHNPFELKKESLPEPVQTASGAEPILTQPVPEREAPKPSKGVQIFLLLLSLLFLIFIVNVERSFVRDLWRVISNENYSSLHLRNQRNTMRQILLLMGYMVFVMQAGIFLYHTLQVFNYTGELLDNVWTCMALVLLVYVVRHGVIGYLRWLFNNEKEMKLFSFDISIFNIMVGLVLLPLNVLINFGPENLIKPLIITGLIAAVLAYIMRQLRWMLTARQLIAGSLFLFFIYLCAVEILPLWAVSKLFW